MRIVDDGRGLGDGEDAERGGQGLRNMRARSAAIGGAFRLLSVPDGGTSLEIVLRP
jgi:two-component system, NarL family, sensor histidine kinase LiaS